jgi:hypothetical protein
MSDFWVGERLSKLLTYSDEQLAKEFPNHKLEGLKRTRRKYRVKVKEGKVVEKPIPEEERRVSTITGWWEVVTANPNDPENPIVTKAHKYSVKTRPEKSWIEPVVSARIERVRIKPPKRDHKVIMVFSDAQIGYRRINGELVPIHDEKAISAMVKFATHLRPNYVVDCGDTTDFAEISRYQVDSNHFEGTLQPSLQRTHDLYAQVTAATPDAEGRRHAVDSNHVKRLGDFMLKNAYPLADVRAPGEKYPAMSYPSLIKLEEVGWEWHGGYGSAEYEYADDLAFTHGTFAVSNGSTASKLSKANYGRNIVQGHKHSIESHYSTDRKGRQFGAFVVGALCRRDGFVPSFHSSIDAVGQPLTHYENWQNGIMVIKDYGEGRYQFDQIPIHDGVIWYDGKEFEGE